MGRYGFFAIVPQQTAYIVEFLGKYQKVLTPGLHFQIPYIQKIHYIHSLKENALEVHEQEAVTIDNVHLNIDGVLYQQINDPYKASYGSEDPIEYCYILAQSIMRSEIGKLSLDDVFEERDMLNKAILSSISQATELWGVKCLRYEIKDVNMSEQFKKVLNLQAESERKKRAEILLSEGHRQSNILQAEGYKNARILEAQGEAEKIYQDAEALGRRIGLIASSMSESKNDDYASLKYKLAEAYIDSLKNLAQPNKQVIVRKNLNDPNELFDKAMNNFEDATGLPRLTNN